MAGAKAAVFGSYAASCPEEVAGPASQATLVPRVAKLLAAVATFKSKTAVLRATPLKRKKKPSKLRRAVKAMDEKIDDALRELDAVAGTIQE